MKQRFDMLSDAGKQLARIPRFGRLLANMPERMLRKIDSPAATYWALYSFIGAKRDCDQTGLIDSGLNTDGAKLLGWTAAINDAVPDRDNFGTREWQSSLAMAILGAIAFEMFCHNQRLGHPPTRPIDQGLAAFKKAVCLRCVAAGAYVNELGQEIDARSLIRNDFKRVEQMNSHGLEYAIMSSTGDDVQSLSDQQLHLLFFADVSTQAFFAAYWAMVWSNSTIDIATVGHWIPDPPTQSNKDYLEFWQMALELPSSVTDPQRFQNMFLVHFDRRLQPDPERPIRSTELLYQAWERQRF